MESGHVKEDKLTTHLRMPQEHYLHSSIEHTQQKQLGRERFGYVPATTDSACGSLWD